MEAHPASLFKEVIPTIVRTDCKFYFTLPTNDKMIEKEKREHGNYYIRLTPSNWERNLEFRIGEEVCIPISCSSIHHKIIDLYGHDRVLKLRFYGSQEMVNGQTQLTFRGKRNTNVRENWSYIACRAESLNEYQLSIYVRMNSKEIKRYQDRFNIIKWRTSVTSTTQRLLDDEMQEGNLHKDHASFLKSRVRRMIVRTHEEYIEHKKAVERLCAMGRRYVEHIRKRDCE